MYNFPLMFQGSTFGSSSPLIHDVNHDGIEDAILVDYDGLITFVGLDTASIDDNNNYNDNTDKKHQKRYFQEYQLPRLLVRKDWIALFLNETLQQELLDADIINRKEEEEKEGEDHNLHWYDTNFEYEDIFDYAYDHGHDGRSVKVQDGLYPVRGYNGDILHQNLNIVQQKKLHDIDIQQRKMEKEEEEEGSSLSMEKNENEASGKEENDDNENDDDDYDNNLYNHGDDYGYGDDYFEQPHLPRQSPKQNQQKEFHSDKNYIYLPPHALSSPTYFEVVQKVESRKNNRQQYSISEYIAFAVSFFIDEDEYTTATQSSSSTHHKKYSTDKVTANDMDTESKRGMYVANALLVIFDLHDKSLKNIHLDLSTDYSSPHLTNEEFNTNGSSRNHNFGVDLDTLEWKEETFNGMGAFAIASPIVVDLGGDRNMGVLMGTSMGFIHCIQVPQATPYFTVQMKDKIEHPIVVEDALNDGKLEIFAIDASANLVCLDYKGKIIWSRNLLLNNEQAVGTSDLVLGDIDGDGAIDVVVTVRTLSTLNQDPIVRIHAINAHGKELEGFPLDVSAMGTKDSHVYDEISLSQIANW